MNTLRYKHLHPAQQALQLARYRRRLQRYYLTRLSWINGPKTPAGPCQWRCLAHRRPIAIWGIITLSLLAGYTHAPSSVIPQDGLTMQTIYQRVSHSVSTPPSVAYSLKSPKKGSSVAASTSFPKTAPLFIFPHAVGVAGERVLIPGYRVYFRL